MPYIKENTFQLVKENYELEHGKLINVILLPYTKLDSRKRKIGNKSL